MKAPCARHSPCKPDFVGLSVEIAFRKWLTFGSEVRYEGLMAEGLLSRVKKPTACMHADWMQLNQDRSCALLRFEMFGCIDSIQLDLECVVYNIICQRLKGSRSVSGSLRLSHLSPFAPIGSLQRTSSHGWIPWVRSTPKRGLPRLS